MLEKRTTGTSTTIGRVVYTIPEVAQMLGINRCLAYTLARQGDLPAIRLGGRVLVPRDRLERFLTEGRFTKSDD
jgi:excisionase family DNA binding protein